MSEDKPPAVPSAGEAPEPAAAPPAPAAEGATKMFTMKMESWLTDLGGDLDAPVPPAEEAPLAIGPLPAAGSPAAVPDRISVAPPRPPGSIPPDPLHALIGADPAPPALRLSSPDLGSATPLPALDAGARASAVPPIPALAASAVPPIPALAGGAASGESGRGSLLAKVVAVVVVLVVAGGVVLFFWGAEVRALLKI
jgi:hypothetical protein